MKSTCRRLLRLGLMLTLCAILANTLLAQAPGNDQVKKGTVERIKVHGMRTAISVIPWPICFTAMV